MTRRCVNRRLLLPNPFKKWRTLWDEPLGGKTLIKLGVFPLKIHNQKKMLQEFEPFVATVDITSVIVYPKIGDGVMNVYMKAEILNMAEWAHVGWNENTVTGKIHFHRFFLKQQIIWGKNKQRMST